MALESFIAGLLGQDLPVRIRAYDGTDVGPRDARTTITLRSRDALIRMATASGELGFARAYIAGDIEIDGNIYDVLSLKDALPVVKLTLGQVKALVQTVGLRNLRKIPPPPEEHRRQGRFHTRRSDSSSIQHHYDVSNEFFRLILGSSLTYSCAVFERPDESLEQAQQRKYELICQKLGLHPGMRLLDIGCGWGGMVRHAAEHHGVRSVGVTISEKQADFAEKQVADAGLTDLVEIRTQDYRDVDDGPYDAISSIGMFEHVGMRRLSEYFDTV
ncbi:MAG: class I SAM-dependent methyltransferase, partial [Acidobacteria bacterium]|nr:class I SAM-dependent methyltransferase [Acidobacteriota bacterium]